MLLRFGRFLVYYLNFVLIAVDVSPRPVTVSVNRVKPTLKADTTASTDNLKPGAVPVATRSGCKVLPRFGQTRLPEESYGTALEWSW